MDSETKQASKPSDIFAAVGKGPFIEKIREAQAQAKVGLTDYPKNGVDDYLEDWLESLGFVTNDGTVRNMRQDVGLFNKKEASNSNHEIRVPEDVVPPAELPSYGVTKDFILDTIADYVLKHNLKIRPVCISSQVDSAIIEALWTVYGVHVDFGAFRSWRVKSLDIAGQSGPKGVALSNHIEQVKRAREVPVTGTTPEAPEKPEEPLDADHVLSILERKVIADAKMLGDQGCTVVTHGTTSMIGFRCKVDDVDYIHIGVLTHSVVVK
jgi:hypothetical protein